MIRVLAIETELFHIWVKTERAHAENYLPDFDRVYVPRITAENLIHDAFTSIARDGAGCVEVCLRLQKALHSLMRLDHHDLRQAARTCRDIALEIADHTLVSESQKNVVRQVAKDS